jgi:hypothetical protein
VWLSTGYHTGCNWEMQGGVDFELSRVKLNFVISMWVVLVSWVYVCISGVFWKQWSASKLVNPPNSILLPIYNLQVHDHHQIFSLFFSWAVFTSFYLYPNLYWIILTWCLVPIWNFSVNVFKRTSCREVPHLLIKTQIHTLLFGPVMFIVCCLMELVLCGFVTWWCS